MRFQIWVLLSCLSLAACAAPRATVDPEPAEQETEEPATETTVNLAQYEDFDPDPYSDEPAGATELEHDVPAQLMEGRVTESATRTVQGFRIQIDQTQNKESADDTLEEAALWWREQGGQTNAPAIFRQNQPPVYILFRQPYYRVRLGDFTTRSEANQVLGLVRQRFPSALIVPDAVTVR